MSFPFAYFITWTCYGTRLHGHAEGSVDRSHNVYGTEFLPSNPALERLERSQMAQPRFALSDLMRSTVHDVIEAHCRHRDWRLHALHVRSTHVHVVVSAPCEPETVMGQFKAWSSRRLRDCGLVDRDRRIWTPHGSTKYPWDGHGFRQAIDYVQFMQGRALGEGDVAMG